MTALVIIITGVWNDRFPTEVTLNGGDISYVTVASDGEREEIAAPAQIRFADGQPVEQGPGAPHVAWHEVPVERLYVDSAQTIAFTGVLRPRSGTELGSAVDDEGTTHSSLYGDAVESGAPLTMRAFEQGLPGRFGGYIVVISVLLFAVSTAIAWSYYGDRCANYLFGARAILPYKIAFVVMHFVGAVLALADVWEMGDVFLGMVILPNLIALVLLSPQVASLSKSYFERKAWLDNVEAHRAAVEQRRRGGT